MLRKILGGLLGALLMVGLVLPAVPVTAVDSGFNLIYTSTINSINLRNIWVDGDYMYLANPGSNRLEVWDIAIPNYPIKVSQVTTGGLLDIIKEGNYIYATGGTSIDAVTVIDVTDPVNPTVVGYTGADARLAFAHGAALNGDFFYVAAQSYGFTIVDISNPAAPVIRGDLSGGVELPNGSTSVHDVEIDYPYAYIASHNGYVAVIDVSDPDIPVMVSSNSLQVQFADIKKVGNYIYSGGAGTGGSYPVGTSWLLSFDVSVPTDTPVLTGALQGTGVYWLFPITSWEGVAGSYLLNTSNWKVIDISDPANMNVVDSYSNPVIYYGRNIFVDGEYIYVSGSNQAETQYNFLIFGPDFTPIYESNSDAWWDADWLYRKVLSVDTRTIPSNIANFPVRVLLDATNFNFSLANNDGSDIRFIDKTTAAELDYDIEWWDSVGETACVWVSVPQVDKRNYYTDYFYLYYGNLLAATTEDAAAVWTGYGVVWHFNEMAGAVINDATVNANTGTAAGTPTWDDYAIYSSGWTDEFGSNADADSLDVGSDNFTILFRINFSSFTDSSNVRVVQKQQTNLLDTTGYYMYSISVSRSQFTLILRSTESGEVSFGDVRQSLSTGTWSNVGSFSILAT